MNTCLLPTIQHTEIAYLPKYKTTILHSLEFSRKYHYRTFSTFVHDFQMTLHFSDDELGKKIIALYSGKYNVYVIQTIYHIREIASRFYGENHSFLQGPCSTQPVQPRFSGTTWCSLQITTHVMDIQAQQMPQAMGLEDCTHPSLHTAI